MPANEASGLQDSAATVVSSQRDDRTRSAVSSRDSVEAASFGTKPRQTGGCACDGRAGR